MFPFSATQNTSGNHKINFSYKPELIQMHRSAKSILAYLYQMFVTFPWPESSLYCVLIHTIQSIMYSVINRSFSNWNSFPWGAEEMFYWIFVCFGFFVVVAIVCSFFSYSFKRGLLCIAVAILELILRLCWHQIQIPVCLCFPNAGVKGMWFVLVKFIFEASTL